jgi:hypothetical protein
VWAARGVEAAALLTIVIKTSMHSDASTIAFFSVEVSSCGCWCMVPGIGALFIVTQLVVAQLALLPGWMVTCRPSYWASAAHQLQAVLHGCTAACNYNQEPA